MVLYFLPHYPSIPPSSSTHAPLMSTLSLPLLSLDKSKYIYIYVECLAMDLPFMCFCNETLLSENWADKVPVFNHSLLRRLD